MSSPLVVEPQPGAEPWNNPEGAGVVSSWVDLSTAVGGGDPFPIAFAAAGAGLDTLGAIADPFGAVASSAVGYAIEHVGFLREPLDALAGDPVQITAQAHTWHRVGVELAAVAETHRQQIPAGPAWEGAAGEAYRGAAAEHTAQLDAVARSCTELAELVVTTGAAVGTVRALIRDLIADFLASALERLLLAAATAALSGSTSVLAALGWVVWDAVLLAARIADRISALLTSLAAAGGRVGRIAAGMLDAADRVGRAAPHVHRAAQAAQGGVDRVPAEQIVEAGKKFSGASSIPQEPAGPAADGNGAPG